jgi:opacity protein-like surface antigen
MSKKWLILLVLVPVVAGVAVAQPAFGVSTGVGGFIGGDFGGGVWNSQSYGNMETSTVLKYPYFGGGAYVFFDAVYAELTVGIFGGKGETQQIFKLDRGDGRSEKITHTADFSITNISIGLLGKYPFWLSDKYSIFPLLGIEYQVVLNIDDSQSDYWWGAFDFIDWNAFWFKAGAGMDFLLTKKVFIRIGALYGIRLANNYEKAFMDRNTNWEGILLGHGLTTKLALGYRF